VPPSLLGEAVVPCSAARGAVVPTRGVVSVVSPTWVEVSLPVREVRVVLVWVWASTGGASSPIPSSAPASERARMLMRLSFIVVVSLSAFVL
jgi:hypothetical protein